MSVSTVADVSVDRVIQDIVSMSESSDPDVWVDEVLRALPDHELALRALIRSRFSTCIRRSQQVAAGEVVPVRNGLRDAVQAPEARAVWLNSWFNGANGPVRLRDAKVEDFEAAAGRARVQAHGLLRSASRYLAVAELMRSRGAVAFIEVADVVVPGELVLEAGL